MKRRLSWLAVVILAIWSAAGLRADGDTAATGAASLIDAVKSGNGDAVRTLIGRRAAVDERELDGTSALHWAARADDLATVGMLLDAGARAAAANRYGITPLWLAAGNGNAAMIGRLLKAGAEVDAALPSGETALLVAARGGSADAVKMLLAHGANVHVQENVFGQTALMLAAADNHPAACQLLIEAGADVAARTKPFEPQRYSLSNSFSGKFTALLYAARQGAIESARVLIDAGADVDERNPEGIAPLLLAVFNGHYDFAAMLVERGADVNAADEAGRTALYQAIDMRRLEFIAGRPAPRWTDTLDSLALVTLLLDRGADANVRLKKQQPNRKGGSPSDNWLIEGTTPFLKAAKNADVPVLRALLEHGADPHGRAPRIQASALMFAAGVGWRELSSVAPEKEALDTVKMLWELGGYDIDAATASTGQTALHGAASRGAVSIIEFLVEHGAKLDVKDKKGRTPLIEAGPIEEGAGAGGTSHPLRPAAQARLARLAGPDDRASAPRETAAR